MHLHVPHRHAPGSDSLSGRAWAWMHQSELDRQLADGADPASSPALQTRAHQLQAIHCRRCLVAEIDAVLAKAEHPPHWHSVRLPVRTPDVRAARDALLALRQMLAAGEELCVPGLALASCLLNDSQGPLYQPCPGGDLAQLAHEARTALAAHPAQRPGQARGGQLPI